MHIQTYLAITWETAFYGYMYGQGFLTQTPRLLLDTSTHKLWTQYPHLPSKCIEKLPAYLESFNLLFLQLTKPLKITNKWLQFMIFIHSHSSINWRVYYKPTVGLLAQLVEHVYTGIAEVIGLTTTQSGHYSYCCSSRVYNCDDDLNLQVKCECETRF